MSGRSPPLRFLAAVVGGWAVVRAAMLAPLWPGGPIAASPPPETRARKAAASSQALAAPVPPAIRRLPPARTRLAPASAPPKPMPDSRLPFPARDLPGSDAPVVPVPRGGPIPAPAPPPERLPGRWSGSAWAFARGGNGAALASAGMLGGSQAGMRLTYRLNRSGARPLSLSARLSAPAGRAAGAEAAFGVEWQPARSLPLRLLAERRQALGGEGRSAFALLAYGGVDDRPMGAGLRLDAYAQAGIVGARSRDLFADGAARLSLPFDEARRVRLGTGVWAAAQPGLARFDAGPHASLRLHRVTLALDWRFRLAGDAAPGSGPTATLSTDF